MNQLRLPLQRGDWVNIRYGSNRMDVYILRCNDEIITWGNPSWLVSEAKTQSLDSFWDDMYYHPILIGPGKERRWRKLLPLMNDVICPFTKPHVKRERNKP